MSAAGAVLPAPDAPDRHNGRHASADMPCASPSCHAPRVVMHRGVPHVKQSYSWDCGLACVAMVLYAVGVPQSQIANLRQLCPTTSVWTVDLAHLLRRFGVDVSFYTLTLGPNPDYANESFYMVHMPEDERRVSRLFQEAAAAGIHLQQRSVESHELAELLLGGRHLVLVLVDKRKLDPWLMAADMCLPVLCGMDLGYAGHFILLVGYDACSHEFILRDPATSVHEHRLSVPALDAARRSFGTDEDLLVVSHPALAASWDVEAATSAGMSGAAAAVASSQQPGQAHEWREAASTAAASIAAVPATAAIPAAAEASAAAEMEDGQAGPSSAASTQGREPTWWGSGTWSAFSRRNTAAQAGAEALVKDSELDGLRVAISASAAGPSLSPMQPTGTSPASPMHRCSTGASMHQSPSSTHAPRLRCLH